MRPGPRQRAGQPIVSSSRGRERALPAADAGLVRWCFSPSAHEARPPKPGRVRARPERGDPGGWGQAAPAPAHLEKVTGVRSAHGPCHRLLLYLWHGLCERTHTGHHRCPLKRCVASTNEPARIGRRRSPRGLPRLRGPSIASALRKMYCRASPECRTMRPTGRVRPGAGASPPRHCQHGASPGREARARGPRRQAGA